MILVTLDTTRADRLGLYGYSSGRTPNLDSVAKKSVIFDHAYSSVGSTTPSHASILTGLYPSSHGVADNGRFALRPRHTTLAEVLGKHGYDTAAFTSAYTVDHRFGLDQGFDVYDDVFMNPRASSVRSFRGLALGDRHWERGADETILRALQWIQEATAKPTFLWLHLYDPHEPYLPPYDYELLRHRTDFDNEITYAQFLYGKLIRRFKLWDLWGGADYDNDVAYMDFLLGRFFEGMRVSGLWQSATLVIVGDHGEGLGEHGYAYHTPSVYDSVLRVPLIVRLPGQRSGWNVETMVRTIDVAPTVFDLLDLAPEASLDGVTLGVHLARNGEIASATPNLLAATQPGCVNSLEQRGSTDGLSMPSGTYAVRSSDFKIILIYRNAELVAEEVYDVVSDPHELNPQAAIPPDRHADLRKELDEFVLQAAAIDPASVIHLDAEGQELLKALGYVVD